MIPSRRTIGRLLAGLVGIEWFVVLLFAGLGLLFGPMAWLAALIGSARPRAAAALLGLPVIVIVIATILLSLDRAEHLDIVDAIGIVAVLIVPALLATALIVAAPRRPAGADR